MSQKYYREQDKRTDEAYKKGREFEYNAMDYLRRRGWHTMRRFGSQGIVFCNTCGKNVPRTTMKCKCGGRGLKASLDVTAYKDGIYLVITCKYSSKGMTVYLDDDYWENLVLYATFYGARAVFAGVDANSRIYFLDLHTLQPLVKPFFESPDLSLNIDTGFYRQKALKKPDAKVVNRLMEEAWSVVEECNRILEDEGMKSTTRARWMEIKVKMIGVINRCIYQAGLNVTTDDLSKMFEKGKELLDAEKTSS